MSGRIKKAKAKTAVLRATWVPSTSRGGGEREVYASSSTTAKKQKLVHAHSQVAPESIVPEVEAESLPIPDPYEEELEETAGGGGFTQIPRIHRKTKVGGRVYLQVLAA